MDRSACIQIATAFSVISLMPVAAAESIDAVRLVNHQPFAIRQPVSLRGVTFNTRNDFIQHDGTNVVCIANVAAEASTEAQPGTKRGDHLTASGGSQYIELLWRGKSLGQLSWDIVVEPAKKRSDEAIVGTKADFAAKFQPANLSFHKTATGPLFDTWTGMGRDEGLFLGVELKIFHSGFIDVLTCVTNETAAVANVYSAIVCRWQHAPVSDRILCYDNRRTKFGENASTHFREVEGRHWHTQHGVDWVRTIMKGGPTVLWMNPFNPSFTVKAEASSTGKTPARYTAASQGQLSNEAQSVPSQLFSVVEIARPNIKSYRDRVRENVLPPHKEGFQFETRLVIQDRRMQDEDAENAFVAYTGYRQQEVKGNTGIVTFGVPSVRFGTAYFPFSTLGENFDTHKLPGMDREAFWPLAADTVNHWRLYADEIRRDLRLAKWLGFHSLRLHHLELLAPIDPKIREAYLDFLFNEFRHLRFKVLVDVYASPRQIEELLRRYGDVIEGIEIENEILIWGIPADRPPQWKEIYETVKRVTPHVTVHLTGQNNTGLFDRLNQLGVPFDKIGLHSYVDSLDALPSARGWALAAANHGARLGKPPAITEWNWRHLTRMTEEARLKIYRQVMEGALATRSIPEFHQFQFQETLAPNPRVGRGNILRHYELLHLSRRPKLEAFEFAKIIQRYTAPDDPVRAIAVNYAELDLDKNGAGTAVFKIKNLTSERIALKALVETSSDLNAGIAGDSHIAIGPKQTRTLKLNLSARSRQPGFYHFFLRLDGGDRFVRYAAGEARIIGQPQFTAHPNDIQYARGIETELDFRWTETAAVVYGTDAPVLEAETAIAIAQTLESATGRRVPFYQLNYLPARLRNSGHLILVGTVNSHELIANVRDQLPAALYSGVTRVVGGKNEEWLVVCGHDSEAAEKAGMDLIMRYWVNARDSAARRAGLVKKDLPRGIDPTKLP